MELSIRGGEQLSSCLAKRLRVFNSEIVLYLSFAPLGQSRFAPLKLIDKKMVRSGPTLKDKQPRVVFGNQCFLKANYWARSPWWSEKPPYRRKQTTAEQQA